MNITIDNKNQIEKNKRAIRGLIEGIKEKCNGKIFNFFKSKRIKYNTRNLNKNGKERK